MRKLTGLLAVALCISSTSYAFCPFEDHFTLTDNTLKFIPFSSKSAINIGVNTDIQGNINNNMVVIQQNSCLNWGNGLLQIRIGKDDTNFCDIDIWDGAGMTEATLSRVNCSGKLKDNSTQIGLTHTLSTFDYQITIN